MKQVTLQSINKDFQEEITIGKHILTLDAEEEQGGADVGPTPHDVLTAALLGCKAMTMRMYAKRKGWDLTGLKLSATQTNVDRTHTRFEVQIDLPAHLSEEEKSRLIDISKKCPVHRILENNVEIITI